MAVKKVYTGGMNTVHVPAGSKSPDKMVRSLKYGEYGVGV